MYGIKILKSEQQSYLKMMCIVMTSRSYDIYAVAIVAVVVAIDVVKKSSPADFSVPNHEGQTMNEKV